MSADRSFLRVLVLVTTVADGSACALGPPPVIRNDIAVIEAGDATIVGIDGTPGRTGNDGQFEVHPGGHTVQIRAISFRPDYSIVPIYAPALISLCVKARPGRRYRIKTAVINGRRQVFFIDASTGQPPKTPCGPDEDDD